MLHETNPEKNPYVHIMPPVAGTQEELDALAEYLCSLNHPEASSPQISQR